MKVVSFNVNSIRMRLHQLEAIIQNHQPDIIGLQETKVQDQDFPLSDVEALGYHAVYHGQKTHYGVALLSRQTPINPQKGFVSDNEDSQRRLVAADYEIDGKRVTVINGYFPQGESQDHPTKFPNKREFYANLQTLLETNHKPTDNIIVMGDMNISPEDIDIGIGEDNRKRWLRTGKCSFLPEEREWLGKLKSWGLQDSFRALNPTNAETYSWFDYRSKGFEREPRRGLRIDLIMATQPLMTNCVDTGVDYEVRGMDKPSDHCPIWAEFTL